MDKESIVVYVDAASKNDVREIKDCLTEFYSEIIITSTNKEIDACPWNPKIMEGKKYYYYLGTITKDVLVGLKAYVVDKGNVDNYLQERFSFKPGPSNEGERNVIFVQAPVYNVLEIDKWASDFFVWLTTGNVKTDKGRKNLFSIVRCNAEKETKKETIELLKPIDRYHHRVSSVKDAMTISLLAKYNMYPKAFLLIMMGDFFTMLIGYVIGVALVISGYRMSMISMRILYGIITLDGLYAMAHVLALFGYIFVVMCMITIHYSIRHFRYVHTLKNPQKAIFCIQRKRVYPVWIRIFVLYYPWWIASSIISWIYNNTIRRPSQRKRGWKKTVSNLSKKLNL